MFCTHCGTENPEGAKFCTNCGKDPSGTATPNPPPALKQGAEKFSSGHWFAGGGSALALVCFFLPWILVSCGTQSFSLSGYGLASGEQGIPPNSNLFLIPVAAIVALILVYNVVKSGQNAAVNLLILVLGVVPLWVLLEMVPKWQAEQAKAAYWGMRYTFQPGLWGTILGCLLIVVGGLAGLRKKSA